MQNFSDATYKNILDYMLSLVPDTLSRLHSARQPTCLRAFI